MLYFIVQEDLEQVIKEIEEADRKKNTIVEEPWKDGPSRRANFSICAHTDKDEIIMFGGEYFNGQKVSVFYLTILSVMTFFFCISDICVW